MLRLTTFGESHGSVVGGVLDGLPSGMNPDYDFIDRQLQRRKPSEKAGGTARREYDKVNWLSGIYNDETTGAPVAFTIENQSSKSSDYGSLRDVYRPSHADYTWEKKYGRRDHRGGGRASARETLVRVVAGALVNELLKKHGIEIYSAVTTIGNISAEHGKDQPGPDIRLISEFGFPDESRENEIREMIDECKRTGDTTGGIITCRITGMPTGLGEPVYHKLQADLASAMMGINAVKGFEYGEGFQAAAMRGSKHNDEFVAENNKIRTRTNHSGGIQGGISNGEDVNFRVAFKPVSSVGLKQKSVNKAGEEVDVKVSGRHDVCVVPRAMPIVESMAALVIADHLMLSKAIDA